MALQRVLRPTRRQGRARSCPRHRPSDRVRRHLDQGATQGLLPPQAQLGASVEDIEDDGGSGSDEEQPSFVQHDVGDAAPRGAAAAPIDGGSSSSDDEDDAGATDDDDDDDDGTDYVPVTVDSRRDRDGRTEYYVSWKGAKNMSQEIYCYYEVLALLNGFLDGFGVASKSRVVLWVWWLNPFQQFLQIMMLQPGQPFLEKLHFFSTSLYPMSPRFSGLPQCS